MKRVFQISCLLVLTGSVIFACTKKEEEEVPTKSNTELLTAHKWKYTNWVAAPPNDTIDIWIGKGECFKDNSYLFFVDGTGLFDEEVKKCEPSDPSTIDFDWIWSNNETELSIIYTKDTVRFTNVSISSSSITAKKDDSFWGYVTVTFEPY